MPVGTDKFRASPNHKAIEAVIIVTGKVRVFDSMTDADHRVFLCIM